MSSPQETSSTYEVSSAISEKDHGLLIPLAASICLVASLLVFALRLAFRWPWHALLGLDDAATGLATAFALIQSALAMSGVSSGLGKRSQLLSADERSIALKVECPGCADGETFR